MSNRDSQLADLKSIEQSLLDRKLLTSFSSDGNIIYLPSAEPSIEQTYHWLSQLARQLKQDNTTEFLIENIQASGLTSPQKWLYQIAVGLITGLLIAMIYGTTTGLIGASIGGISYGIILGFSPEVYPIYHLKLSWKFAKTQLLSSILEGLGWGIIYGLIDALICGLIWGSEGIIEGMADSLVWGLIEGLIWGLCISDLNYPTVSNQGIKESGINAIIFTIIGGIAWVILYIAVLLLIGEPLEPRDLLLDGIGNGIFFGIYVGGLACLQHFILRLIFKYQGVMPWNYAKFLNYAVELGFLECEGGRYRFINESVQAYFAQMTSDQDKASQ
jgi:hypothetical protein